MKTSKFQKKDTLEVTNLIINTFKKFNSNDVFNQNGVKWYLNFYDPKTKSIDEIYSTFKKSPISFIVKENNIIIGTIRGTKNKITDLFVDKKHHKKGIGKKLMLKYEEEAIKQGSKYIKLQSSPYAIEFYKRLGYKKTTGIRNFKGLKINPMKKILE